MANMFRDASKKTVTPNLKEEAAQQTERVDTQPAAAAKGRGAEKREKPQIRTSDAGNSASMDVILSGKLAVKPTGGQRSVYLDDEVFAAVEELAEKNGATKSKIINMILRSALFGE